MIKSRRIMVIALIIILLLSSITGCGPKRGDNGLNLNTEKTGFPIVKEPVSFTFFTPASQVNKDFKENPTLQKYEKMTNIKINWEVVPAASLKEKRNLLLMSGDYYDAFYKCSIPQNDEMNYGKQGTFIAIDKYLEYAPNFSKILKENDGVRKAITLLDGHIYSMPSIGLPPNTDPLFWYNKAWADKLGISEPQNIDQLYAMLKAFREKDPNGNGKKDEIPMLMSGVASIKQVMNLFGLPMSQYNCIVDNNGIVSYVPTTTEYKEALIMLAKFYSEELIDKDCFIQQATQFSAKAKSNPNIAGSVIGHGAFPIVGEERSNDYYAITPLMNKNGERVWGRSNGVSTGAFVITDKCKAPEALVRWADYFYSEEGGKLAWAGTEGEQYEFGSDGKWSWKLKDGQEQNDLRYNETLFGVAPGPFMNPSNFWAKISYKSEADLFPIRDRVRQYSKEPFPMVYFTDEQQKRISTITTDINSYLEQTIVKYIMGQININENWTEFTNKIKSLGGDELVKIHQEKYNEYKNK